MQYYSLTQNNEHLTSRTYLVCINEILYFSTKNLPVSIFKDIVISDFILCSSDKFYYVEEFIFLCVTYTYVYIITILGFCCYCLYSGLCLDTVAAMLTAGPRP